MIEAEPPAWWPEVARRCYDDLMSYRLVGASSCADRITEAIAAIAQVAPDPDALRDAGRRYAALKPDTALYVNVLDYLLACELPAVPARAAALAAYRSGAQREVAASTTSALREARTVLVHDYSSAVLAALRALRDERSRRVVVSECALLGQGPRVARMVADMGHRVVYASDCSIGRLIGDVDAFVTGVEGFYADGSLANTVGTLAIALLCREVGATVLAPAELLKFDRSAATAAVPGLSARLLHPWPDDAELRAQGWQIDDHVLDAVPAQLVSSYVTEAGIAAPEAVAAMAADVTRRIA